MAPQQQQQQQQWQLPALVDQLVQLLGPTLQQATRQVLRAAAAPASGAAAAAAMDPPRCRAQPPLRGVSPSSACGGSSRSGPSSSAVGGGATVGAAGAGNYSLTYMQTHVFAQLKREHGNIDTVPFKCWVGIPVRRAGEWAAQEC